MKKFIIIALFLFTLFSCSPTIYSPYYVGETTFYLPDGNIDTYKTVYDSEKNILLDYNYSNDSITVYKNIPHTFKGKVITWEEYYKKQDEYYNSLHKPTKPNNTQEQINNTNNIIKEQRRDLNNGLRNTFYFRSF